MDTAVARSVKKMRPTLIDDNFLTLGISLQALRDLKVNPALNFVNVKEEIKRITEGTVGNRSLASHLWQDEKTRHLVGKAEFFVSHAWEVSFGETLATLENHFEGKPTPFLWISVALIDQYASGVNFTTWAETFEMSLRKIGNALLLLDSGQKPKAVGRSWCCLEWVFIKRWNIPFEFCVSTKEVEILIEKMRSGMGMDEFYDLFAGIDVEKARATEPSDAAAIIDLMRKIGIKKVNDVVMLSLKKWLLQVASESEKRAHEGTNQGTNLLNSKACLHMALGEYADALNLGERALVSAKQANDPILEATMLGNLANIFKVRGDLSSCENYLRRALDIDNTILGSTHPAVAVDLFNLAECRKMQGDYGEAELLFRKALYIDAMAPENELQLAAGINNFAVFLEEIRKGNNESAEMMEKALGIWIRAYGDNHIKVAHSRNNLAEFRRARRDYAAAEVLYGQAISTYKKILGDNDITVASSLSNFGEFFKEQGHYDQAEQCYREAIAIWRQALGDNSSSVAVGLNNLAQLLQLKKNYSEAEQYFREALVIDRKAFGNDHPTVAQYLNNLGALLKEQGDNDEAENTYCEALRIWSLSHDGPHANVASCHNNLAIILQIRGDFGVATRHFENAISIWKQVYGPDHQLVADGLENFATLKTMTKEVAAADRLLCESLSIRKKVLGSSHHLVVQSLYRFAHFRKSANNYSGAVPIFRELLAVLRTDPRKDEEAFARELNSLAFCLFQIGAQDEARKLGAESLAIATRILSPNHRLTQTLKKNWGQHSGV